MPFFRTSGGSFLEIDLPDARNLHAVERFEHMQSTGELTEVDGDTLEWVESDGAKKLAPKPVATEPEPEPEPEPEDQGQVDEKEQLFAALDERGIAYKRTFGVARLRELMTEE